MVVDLCLNMTYFASKLHCKCFYWVFCAVFFLKMFRSLEMMIILIMDFYAKEVLNFIVYSQLLILFMDFLLFLTRCTKFMISLLSVRGKKAQQFWNWWFCWVISTIDLDCFDLL